eukprot:SAG31_NODE_9837_length_1221_cov_2.360963_2_plen_93_part_00
MRRPAPTGGIATSPRAAKKKKTQDGEIFDDRGQVTRGSSGARDFSFYTELSVCSRIPSHHFISFYFFPSVHTEVQLIYSTGISAMSSKVVTQ